MSWNDSAGSRSWDCGECLGTGVVFANRVDAPNAAPFAYRCTCWRGQNDRRRFPSIADQGAAVTRVTGVLLKPVKAPDEGGIE